MANYTFSIDTKTPLSGRLDFSKIHFQHFDTPNSQGVQVSSYQNFIDKDLANIIKNFSPFKSTSGDTQLLVNEVIFESPTLSEEECFRKYKSFQYALHIEGTLINNEQSKLQAKTSQVKVFLGDIPCLTKKGNFIINGVEKFVISQIVRAPGAYMSSKSQIKLSDSRRRVHEGILCELLPIRGALMLFKISITKEGVKYIEIVARNGSGNSLAKIDGASFLKALGFDLNALKQTFSKTQIALNTIEMDEFNPQTLIDHPDFIEVVSEISSVKNFQKNLDDKRNSPSFTLYSLLFEFCQKYADELDDLKTSLDNGIIKNTEIKKIKNSIQNLIKSSYELLKGISVEMSARRVVSELGIPAARIAGNKLSTSYRDQIMFYFFKGIFYDIGCVGRVKLNEQLSILNRVRDRILGEDVFDNNKKLVFKEGTLLDKIKFSEFKKLHGEGKLDICHPISQNSDQVVMCERLSVYKSNISTETVCLYGCDSKFKEGLLQISDFISIFSCVSHFEEGIGSYDDIDHLGNKRLRLIRELLVARVQMAMSRINKLARDRMDSLERKVNYFALKNESVFSVGDILNTNPFQIVIKEFFNSHQLTQFLDQQNPLSELANKRRISAMGPGGIKKEDPNLGVRDVHYSHYGRICPIETPEGMNIGLIMSLALYGWVDDVGFLCSPYYKVQNGVVTTEVEWLTTYQEDDFVIVESVSCIDKKNNILDVVVGRYRGSIGEFYKHEVDYIDISPNQVFSLSTTLIPFLEHNDANRALMGSNMQRQAVPLLKAYSPVVGTGVERKAAQDSGFSILSEISGKITEVDGNRIVVSGGEQTKTYDLCKYKKSNQNTCINQIPIVKLNQDVQCGEVLADGPAMKNGELSLGQNLLVAFTTWYGFGYEDAVILSSRLFKEDAFTSIHTQRHTTECVRTKSGDEEITREIPKCSFEEKKYLDEDGIIMVGASVEENDIIVGKITPKVGGEQTAEEKLLQVIFSEKVSNVRNSSLRVPPGGGGIVTSVVRLAKHLGDDLDDDVIETIQIYVSQKRKIQVGDKIAGRHGNKGVIAKIVPMEDMPFLEDGTPADIILSPLGVPSRMNIGQVLESHLGMAARGMTLTKILEFFFNDDVANASAMFGHHGNDIKNLFEVIREYMAELKLTNFQQAIDNVGDADLRIILSRAGLDEDSMNVKVLNPVFAGSNIQEISDLFDESYWKNYQKQGKFIMYDGKTGEQFQEPISVGVMYIMKLDHMVDDKIYARSVGPYSKITQQPLGGKCQNGGQRFGEMEVWVMEAYGAAYNLRELLTLKSDDVYSRNAVFSWIMSDTPFPEPRTPESFKLLVRKLEGVGLRIGVKFGMVDKMVSCDEYLKHILVVDPLPHEVYNTKMKKNIL